MSDKSVLKSPAVDAAIAQTQASRRRLQIANHSISKNPSSNNRTLSSSPRKPTIFERRASLRMSLGEDNPKVSLPDNNFNGSDGPSSSIKKLFPRTPYPAYQRASEYTPLLTSRPASPNPSYFGSNPLRKAIDNRRIRSRRRGYDDLYENDMVESGKGVRTYAHTHTSIDHIHDKVKEGVRLRRLLRKKGIRGSIERIFDRLQGWIAISIIGVITAFIAFSIVRTESWLFSLRYGYCSTSWFHSKQFCCDIWDISHDNHNNNIIFISSKSLPSTTDCPDWVNWTDVFGNKRSKSLNWLIAVIFALISSIITVYISASNAPWVNNSKTAHLDAYHHAASGRQILSSSPQSQSQSQSQSQIQSQSRRDSISSFLFNDVPRSFSVYSRSISRKSSYSSDDDDSKSSGSDFEEQLAEEYNNNHHSNNINNNIESSNGEVLTPTAEKSTLLSPKSYPVMYFAAGSGIPELKAILSGFVIRGYLGVCTLICKCVGLALSVASGLSLGKEGPMVQIAACVGNITSRYIRKFETNEAKRREILSAACSAGVSVAFGAPIGGVLFALEEVSTYFPPKVMWRSFFCASIAAATLKYLDPFGTGKTVLFEVTYDQDWKFFELPFFFLIAIVMGIYGAYFSKLNIWWGKNIRAKLIVNHPVIEVIVVTLITVIISSTNPLTEMGGTELVSILLSECPKSPNKTLKGVFANLCAQEGQAPWSIIKTLILAILIKGGLTIITFGMKLPAGIFIPTLGVGACFGRMVGLMVEYWSKVQPDFPLFSLCKSEDKCMLSAIYALVGAASALSGVTRMTISLVVIVCELTGTLSYVIPTMLSILIAKTLADSIEHKGIYDSIIDMTKLPFLDAKHEYRFGSDSVLDVATKKIPVIRIDKEHSVSTLLDKLDILVHKGLSDSGFPLVLNDDGTIRLIGYIAANELEHALDSLSHNPTAGVRFTPFDTTLQSSMLTQSSTTSRHKMLLKRPQSMVQDGNYAPLSANPYDLSAYCDQSPVIVRPEAPMVLVHDNFSKLGARQVFVVDSIGGFQGVIYRKRWIEYLKSLE